jgi:hypothetical protein
MQNAPINQSAKHAVPPRLEETSASERIQIVAPASWAKRVDEWRRKHPDLPNRSAAIRMLVDLALSKDS